MAGRNLRADGAQAGSIICGSDVTALAKMHQKRPGRHAAHIDIAIAIIT